MGAHGRSIGGEYLEGFCVDWAAKAGAVQALRFTKTLRGVFVGRDKKEQLRIKP